MATAVTTTTVRTRWPYLASTTTISDALLTILIAEADSTVNTWGRALLIRREEAITHYAAHKATLTIEAGNSGGMATGPVAAESFLHRSRSRAIAASSSTADPMSADLEQTVPGRVLLTLLRATLSTPRLIQ